MDEAGWASIADVLGELAITRADLDRAVVHNDKARLQVRGDQIRACQGHSLTGMPVTLEGLEESWEPVVPRQHLWHGTRAEAIEGIAVSGIVPVRRTHVHLAEDVESKVGKRSSIDFLLEVDPGILGVQSITVFRSPNGVLLVRAVPCQALVGARAVSKRGRRDLLRAKTLLGLRPTMES
jgi:putative RNA 2'-phosphotransferase